MSTKCGSALFFHLQSSIFQFCIVPAESQSKRCPIHGLSTQNYDKASRRLTSLIKDFWWKIHPSIHFSDYCRIRLGRHPVTTEGDMLDQSPAPGQSNISRCIGDCIRVEDAAGSARHHALHISSQAPECMCKFHIINSCNAPGDAQNNLFSCEGCAYRIH